MTQRPHAKIFLSSGSPDLVEAHPRTTEHARQVRNPPPTGRTGAHGAPQDVTKDVLNSELILKHQKQQCLYKHTHICISMYVGIAMSRKKSFLFLMHLSKVD